MDSPCYGGQVGIWTNHFLKKNIELRSLVVVAERNITEIFISKKGKFSVHITGKSSCQLASVSRDSRVSHSFRHCMGFIYRPPLPYGGRHSPGSLSWPLTSKPVIPGWSWGGRWLADLGHVTILNQSSWPRWVTGCTWIHMGPLGAGAVVRPHPHPQMKNGEGSYLKRCWTV